ncbi:MAG: AbgT family transporter, partial [Atopostipes sp.]|nr:AbgT family transporter [Atopostipes sp.]
MSEKNTLSEESTGVLGWIEKVGNRLPHPVVLFIILSAIVILLSHLMASMGIEVSYFDAAEGTDVTVKAISLLNADGINHIFNSAVSNFTGFAPLGTVLVAMLGVGVAEWTGLIESMMKKLLENVPGFLLSAAVVFAGIMSNIASDVGYVVIVPIGAMIFAAAGRHPIAGLAAAFSGVSAGFSANLFPGPLDAMMVGISNETLLSSGIEYQMGVTANWYFLIASTFLLTIVGAIVTDKLVEPRLGEYTGSYKPDDEPLTKKEIKGLRNALIVFLIFIAIMAYAMFAPDALFQSFDEAMGTMSLNNFLGDGLLFSLFLMFTLPGLAYGITVNKIENTSDFVEGMTESMRTMGGFLVLTFFASQLINYFNYSNIGIIMAKNGANFLESIHLTGLLLLIAFILLTAFINLFMGSASAKWTLLSPIFSPMFYELNIAPEA